MTHTLNDCGCIAKVYSDGSGVDIEFCAMHLSAPDLLKALHSIVAMIEKSEPRPVHPGTGELLGRRPLAQQMIDIANAAITKAEQA